MKFLTLEDTIKRIEEIGKLDTGWLNGEGEKFNERGLELLIAYFSSKPSHFIFPLLYPTEEGEIQANWDINGTDISAYINLDTWKINYFMDAKFHGNMSLSRFEKELEHLIFKKEKETKIDFTGGTIHIVGGRNKTICIHEKYDGIVETSVLKGNYSGYTIEKDGMSMFPEERVKIETSYGESISY